MGSFDMRCGLSNLPICNEDEVCDFILADLNPFRLSNFICYTTDLWAPRSIQLYGKYYDYGQITPHNPESWQMQTLLAGFEFDLIPYKPHPGNNPKPEIITPENLTFEELEDGIHYGKLYTKPAYRLPPEDDEPELPNRVLMSRMMVRREVFDELVSWGYQIENYPERVVLTVDQIVERSEATIINVIKKYLNEDAVFLAVREIETLCRENWRNNEMRNPLASAFTYYQTTHANIMRFRAVATYVQVIFAAVQSAVNRGLEPMQNAFLRDVLTELAKFVVFSHNMEELAINWAPQQGGQDGDVEAQKRFHTFCADLATRDLTKWDNDE